jgi:hypothetical protein
MCVIFSGLNSLGREEGQRIARQKAEVDAAFKSLLADAIPQEIPSQPDSEFLWLAVMSLVHGIAMLKEPKKQIKQEILSRALNLMLAGFDGEKS